MNTVTAAVVAHEDRRARAVQLHDELSLHYPTGLLLDTTGIGCERNHLDAWDSAAGNAASPWCMVVEDDAVLADGFFHHLGYALLYSPAPVLSLYLGRGRPVHWQVRIGNAVRFDRPYIVTHTLLHCVAVCIRTDLVSELIEDARVAVESSVHKPIDEALTEAVKNRNLPVAYTNPSLVNHADGPSVTPHRYLGPHPEPRVAWRFGVRESWLGQFSAM